MRELARLVPLIEPVVAGTAAIWLLWTGGRLLLAGSWLGLALVLPGLLAGTWCGVSALRAARTLRAPVRPSGPGVVMIEEGRIVYLGPHTGGAIAVAELVEVVLTRADRQSGMAWILRDLDGMRLVIPDAAEGAGAIVDALAPLSGFNGLSALAAMAGGGPSSITLWRRKGAVPRALGGTPGRS